jgi:hypothetical protein
MSTRFLWLLAALLLAGCVEAPPPIQSNPRSGAPAASANSAPAGIDSASAHATYQAAAAVETAAAAAVTRQAEQEMATVAAATAQAEAVATGTAVAIGYTQTATADALNTAATTSALYIVSTREAAAARATAVDLDNQARMVEWAAADEARRLANQRAAEEQWMRISAILWTAVALAIPTLALSVAYYLYRRSQPWIIERPNQQPMVISGGGHQLLEPVRAARPTTVQQPLALPEPEEEEMPHQVDWPRLLEHTGSGLALGAGAERQIISLDPQRTPHLLVAGMSGAGKTRRLLRPLLAQALAAGYMAVLMNESGSDFSPFYDQANVRIVRGDVYAYMSVIEAALGEMEEREAILRDYRISEWQRLPESASDAPPTLLVIDELLALASKLSNQEQRDFWGLLTDFASRARKVGMYSIGLATDPTYRALGQGGLNYRTQCGRVVFRMYQAAGSRSILDENGAEQLADGQFLALLDQPGVRQGMAAHPSDEQLGGYLRQQRIIPHDPPAWLLPAGNGPLYTAPRPRSIETQWGTITADEAQKIASMYEQGASLRSIEDHVFGSMGGAAHYKVKVVLEGAATTAVNGRFSAS